LGRDGFTIPNHQSRYWIKSARHAGIGSGWDENALT